MTTPFTAMPTPFTAMPVLIVLAHSLVEVSDHPAFDLASLVAVNTVANAVGESTESLWMEAYTKQFPTDVDTRTSGDVPTAGESWREKALERVRASKSPAVKIGHYIWEHYAYHSGMRGVYAQSPPVQLQLMRT